MQIYIFGKMIMDLFTWPIISRIFDIWAEMRAPSNIFTPLSYICNAKII
jgi:hypothetical protein